MLDYVRQIGNLPSSGLTYGDGGSGCRRLRQSVARFVSRNFETVTPVEAEHVTITNGISAANEHLTNLVADPGEAILLGRPYYGAFPGDIQLRTGVHCVSVSFGDIDPLSENAISAYEEAVTACRSKGQRVAGLMLCNPHNPLGRCYSRSMLIKLMTLCQKHKIHLISDEIYALSVWRTTSGEGSITSTEPTLEQFTSVLSIPTFESNLDPSLVHVLWGLSKDFGANGIRLGCIISQHNPSIHAAMVPVSKYSYASSLAEHVASTMLDDDKFIDRYLAENDRKLLRHFLLVKQWVVENQIKHEEGANAAFFFWVNLGEFYLRHHEPPPPVACSGSPTSHLQSSLDDLVSRALLDERVFLASGATFGSEKPGWFRIVFSVQEVVLEEGLKRILEALS
ncbi:hypothetical protein LTR84_009760 [Exophiala bonariae]|uniref:Aminotransferase class I/classII large domain-containing protein n=1 Tax=Exophiala bonariae TaxID=1690606 RepID=A0AAV9NKS9_9EURO|nr:hypothetical protein LTR84_009760 [Exophiala bonariae]